MDAISVAKINALTKMMKGVNKILDIKTTTTALLPGSEKLVSIPVEMNISKFLIKTIFIKAKNKDAYPDITIRTSASTAGFVSYRNSREGDTVYDVVELAYIDDDNSGKLHLVVVNKGTIESAFDIRIIAVSTL